MIVGIIALASALTAPRADMPLAEQLLRKVEAANLKVPFYRVVTLDVAPDGRVVACEAGDGKGEAASIAKACTIASELRFRLTAKIDGKPAYSRTRITIMAFDGPGDKPRVSLPPELVLSVNRLPSRVKDSLDVNLNLLISPAGSVDRCEAVDDKYQAYANLACAQMLGKEAPVVRDREGIPVSYVNPFRTRFLVDGASSKIAD